MAKSFLQKIKEKLEKEKPLIEAQLSRFAKKDVKPRGDWDTLFPKMNGEVGGGALETKAKQIEEYERLLPVEHALEKRLVNINLALEKIEKGNYGVCEKCKKKIPKERLLACPEARYCLKCPPR